MMLMIMIMPLTAPSLISGSNPLHPRGLVVECFPIRCLPCIVGTTQRKHEGLKLPVFASLHSTRRYSTTHICRGRDPQDLKFPSFFSPGRAGMRAPYSSPLSSPTSPPDAEGRARACPSPFISRSTWRPRSPSSWASACLGRALALPSQTASSTISLPGRSCRAWSETPRSCRGSWGVLLVREGSSKVLLPLARQQGSVSSAREWMGTARSQKCVQRGGGLWGAHSASSRLKGYTEST
jgi:hypothetical protein